MMVTRRSSSSEVSSPARLFRSTSAFLHTRLAGEKRSAGFGLWEDEERTVAATDTLDLGQGVDDLLLAVNVGVEQTQDVVEVALEVRSADALLGVHVPVHVCESSSSLGKRRWSEMSRRLFAS